MSASSSTSRGPKIRLGNFTEGSSRLQPGQAFTITTRELAGNNEIASTTYEGLPGDVNAGDQILIDDGKVRLRVTEVEGTDVHTQVVVGGRISDHKGINLPGVPVSVPAMSEKDIEDLRWALHLRVDFIALSFVRSADDVEDVREIMREEGVCCPSSPRSRSRRRSTTSTRSSRPSTGSWWPAVTSAWSARSRTCRSCRSGWSRRPAATPSPSSWPPRCSSR